MSPEFAAPEAARKQAPLSFSRAETAVGRKPGRLADIQVQRAPAPPAAKPTAAPASTPRTTRVEGVTASVSWIDSRSPAGSGALGIADPTPPATINEGFITAQSGFRFANYVHGWVETPDSTHVTGGGFVNPSGLFRGLSKFDVPSHAYPEFRTGPNRTVKDGIEGIDLFQTVGARTVSPATAATVVGGIPGRMVANAIWNFPPIWTNVWLRLMANGKATCELRDHSFFPSIAFYCGGPQTSTYTALAPEQTKWQEKGWGGGNPWNDDRPIIR